MTNFLRSTALAATVAALMGTQASAASVGATTPATGRAQITKALTLTAVNNLDFGSIVVWGSGTATLDPTGGISCTASNLVCAATGTPAEFKVTGSNNQTVTVNTPDATLTNQSDSTQTLTLVMNGHGPTSVLLPNSGSTGTNFKVGGAITIPENVKDGVYQGNLNVTVNY